MATDGRVVVTRLFGGLGNQMFQYAAGKALALHLDAALKLDVGAYAHYKSKRSFDLANVFEIGNPCARTLDLFKVLGWRGLPVFRDFLLTRKEVNTAKGRLTLEPHFQYWPGFWDAAPQTYVFGYWQSERYFRAISDLVRQDFKFRIPLVDLNEQVAEMIRTTDSVSLHVRRGDYVSDKNARATHGVCTAEYYKRAVGIIKEKLPNPMFFVFSDEPDWVRENLPLPYPAQYTRHNRGQNSHLDMQLMSLCKHHVIANSSFSWWAAWLRNHQEGLVVAPRRWFAKPGIDTSDLYCSDWMVL